MGIKEITAAESFDAVLGEPRLAVVDAYANWCGPCKAIAPKMESMSDEFSDVSFYKFDVDQLGQLAQQYEVTALPTFLFFKNGKLLDKVTGADPVKVKHTIMRCR